MPRLWSETIEAHRRDVHDAILDTAARLVAHRGLLAVTMSQIAEDTGIGRATLYKYFADVEAILLAWHERAVRTHLEQLVAIRDRHAPASDRLHDVLETYALIQHEHHVTELAGVLHGGDHVARARHHLTALVRDLLAEAVGAGDVRDDLPTGELATYCLHALEGARSLPSKAAVRRLVAVVEDALRGP